MQRTSDAQRKILGTTLQVKSSKIVSSIVSQLRQQQYLPGDDLRDWNDHNDWSDWEESAKSPRIIIGRTI